MDKAYFFDTYAIIELLKGNTRVKPYQPLERRMKPGEKIIGSRFALFY